MRILIANDGSDHAERAVRLVAGMEWPEGTVFRVIEAVTDPLDVLETMTAEPLAPAVADRVTGTLARATALLERGDRLVERATVRGRAADAILREAHGADLIALGHRGHGQVASLLLGSVAAEVVERSSVPALVARQDSLGPIVLGDDGSVPSRAARAVLERWPAFRAHPIRVVSAARVMAPLASGIAPTMRRAAADAYAIHVEAVLAEHDAIARDGAAGLRAAGLPAEASAVIGDPADAILKAAEQVGAALIVVGSRGRGGIAALLGSVARAVVLRAKCSVLVVHAAP